MILSYLYFEKFRTKKYSSMAIPMILKNYFGITPNKVSNLSSSLALKFLYIAFASSAFVYILFQKKLLSKRISKIVSKLFFLPTFPITVLMRYGNYWTIIDETVILGKRRTYILICNILQK